MSQLPGDGRVHGEIDAATSMSTAKSTGSMPSASARLLMRVRRVSSPVWFSSPTDGRTAPSALGLSLTLAPPQDMGGPPGRHRQEGHGQTVPTVLFPDGPTLTNPSLAQVKQKTDG
ncbi:hypothetical protein WJ438_14460 [Streptomyces sp. GD-15H]